MNIFRTLDDLSPKGKIVLLRVDLNVPMQNGQVSDMTRIERVLPTIRELTAKGGKVVLLAKTPHYLLIPWEKLSKTHLEKLLFS